MGSSPLAVSEATQQPWGVAEGAPLISESVGSNAPASSHAAVANPYYAAPGPAFCQLQPHQPHQEPTRHQHQYKHSSAEPGTLSAVLLCALQDASRCCGGKGSQDALREDWGEGDDEVDSCSTASLVQMLRRRPDLLQLLLVFDQKLQAPGSGLTGGAEGAGQSPFWAALQEPRSHYSAGLTGSVPWPSQGYQVAGAAMGGQQQQQWQQHGCRGEINKDRLRLRQLFVNR